MRNPWRTKLCHFISQLRYDIEPWKQYSQTLSNHEILKKLKPQITFAKTRVSTHCQEKGKKCCLKLLNNSIASFMGIYH